MEDTTTTDPTSAGPMARAAAILFERTVEVNAGIVRDWMEVDEYGPGELDATLASLKAASLTTAGLMVYVEAVRRRRS